MKPIAIGLSPNVEKNDIWEAVKNILRPSLYKEGKNSQKLEEWFKSYFSFSYAVNFNSGRSALYAILSGLGVGAGDEVIMQAFTCMVVANSINAVGAKPVFADIENELTLNPKEVERKITKKTKAIVVQYTFGIPGKIEEIKKIAQKNKIFLIEDVAHTIGAELKGKKLGTFGDAAFFSFGRDKAFSSVFGGMVITGNKKLGEKIVNFQKHLPYPENFWIFQQLFHPIAFSLVLPLYTKGILGKLLLVSLQKLNLLSFPVSQKEKEGIFSREDVKKLPNSLADLALLQLGKVDRYNKKRMEITSKYNLLCKKLNIHTTNVDNIPLLRFPIFISSPDKMKKFFRKYNIYLGNWYTNVVDPKGCNLEAVNYKKSSCLTAEKLAKEVVNLPTYPTMTEDDVERVCKYLTEYYKKYDNN